MIKVVTIITIIFLIVIIVMVRRHSAKTTTSLLILNSQLPTNNAMRYAQQELDELFLIPKMVSSTLVANIWGHGVMAFEFVFEDLKVTNEKKDILLIEEKLNEYADKKNLKAYEKGNMVFKITDFWQSKVDSNNWHIDVAYIVNEVTLEYTHDIEKLNNQG